jgi:FkbM family methyltransferase
MRTDVVIKTWWNDLAFCSYAIRFLEKYWQEAQSNIIVLADRNCHEVCRTWGFSSRVRYYYVDPWPDGNQFEGYLTLLLDHFSDADLFAIFDSDTMLLEPMRVTELLTDGKPIIWFNPYDDNDTSPQRTVPRQMWAPIMERWLGVKPQADYMQRFPFVYWASSLRAVRRLITAKTGIGLLESLYSAVPYQPASFFSHPFKFCEHNVISFYCALHEQNRYELRDVNGATKPPNVRQYHSWSQWNLETQRQLDHMLSEGYAPDKIPTKKTAEGWTIVKDDVLDGHSSLVERFGRIDIDVGALPTHDFIRPYLLPGSVVIDVGAHIGNFTIPMMRALGRNGLVLAYEPHPSIFSCLQANVAKERAENLEIADCIMQQVALGPAAGLQKLYCNPTNCASNTLLEGILSWPPTVEVEVVSLDESIQTFGLEQGEISFIKIDVEGGELGVLRGAGALLNRYHPALFMETSENFFPISGVTEEEFFAYLRWLGYSRFVPFPSDWVAAGHHAHDTLALP